MWSFIKLIFWIIVVIILFYHWNVVIDFFSSIIDWAVYGMKLISIDPPEIPNP